MEQEIRKKQQKELLKESVEKLIRMSLGCVFHCIHFYLFVSCFHFDLPYKIVDPVLQRFLHAPLRALPPLQQKFSEEGTSISLRCHSELSLRSQQTSSAKSVAYSCERSLAPSVLSIWPTIRSSF
ncbi:hypothetical protein L596_026935 [Steinernema carpocapsae]|uniref:Uncharacterized protein n=1 Tax=Steinernema carpocapsae TaxID=34508 RepID=A0A4U5M2Z5_STECR|nr:hypothetical protein L596_026935 [Steinernema carpocapsae]